MPSATASGFPYPVGSDELGDTDLHIKALADFLETRLGNVPWINVGSGGSAPAFDNAWVNYGLTYQAAGFRKVGDMVSLRGSIKTGTLGQSAFTLPAGYRPPASSTVLFGSAASYVEVTDAGLVIIQWPANTYVSLDGVEFSVTA